ncbi:MAG TPA: T9SS type A sorting domain-containing protein [Bacteroidia bacterium]|jgi:hypothetical protein|nr:T9SS type A sorting domain-containing protein [Bacteroidia bacterium]
MKRTLTLIVFICCCPFAKAQSWAAPGATWYYNFQYFSQEGYERIQNTGDTVINSKQYNKLQIYRQFFDQSSQTSGSYYVSQLEFTREDSGVVYNYRDSADYVLYDFNAQPGDHWVVHGDPQFQTGICDTESIYVDSISTTVINATTLRVLYTSSPGNKITFMGPIIEKIGCSAYMFPYQNCVTDVPEGYGLRCYLDSANWNYHDPYYANMTQLFGCDYITDVHSYQVDQAFEIFPQPANTSITIGIPGFASRNEIIFIKDAEGKILKTIPITSSRQQLSVEDLADGIYFISSSGNDLCPQKFLVIH